MTSERRRPSGMTRLTDVECPACEGQSANVPGAICATCNQRGIVALPIATQFHIDQAKRANAAPKDPA